MVLNFVKSTGGSVAVYVLTVKVLTLTTTCECFFFIVGTNNFIEYLQSYQILIFIYYKFYFIIFIIIRYTVYVVGTLAAI